MSKTDNFVTNEEMIGFISGLFSQTNPEPDPNWDLLVPEIDSIDGQGVEFVTDSEVKTFISGLFEK